MEKTVYEKDYKEAHAARYTEKERQKDEMFLRLLEETSLFANFGERLRTKSLVLEKHKERKYNNLLRYLDAFVKQYGGKIRAEIDEKMGCGKITAELPFWEFWGWEDFLTLEMLPSIADHILFEPLDGNRIALSARVWFLRPDATQQEIKDMLIEEIQKHPNFVALLERETKSADQ